MAQSTYEITDKGTDRESLGYGGYSYWLDITSDPQNWMGWIRVDEDSAEDFRSVSEVVEAVPGARDYIVARTADMIVRAKERAAEFGYPERPIRRLQQELDEAR